MLLEKQNTKKKNKWISLLLETITKIWKKKMYTKPFIEHFNSPIPAFCVKIVNDVEILTGMDPRPLPNTTTRWVSITLTLNGLPKKN